MNQPMDDITQSVEEWTGPDLPDGPISEEIAALMMQRLESTTRYIARQERKAAVVLEAEQARVTAWLDAVTATARERAAQLDARLSEWGLDMRDAYGRKSIPLPHGKVVTRESGGGWAVVDEAAALAWASKHHPELVGVKTTFKVADAKRATSGLTATDAGEVVDVASGEMVPGIKVEPKVVTASVVIGGAS